jgi:DNA-binding transcriptional ArsR family regulator
MDPNSHSAAKREPTAELLAMVAGRFRALAEPARLGILHTLEAGPLTVTELVQRTGLGQGNLSKHLQQLHATGFVMRTRKGLFVHYSLADANVLALCEIMCGRLEQDLESARATVTTRRNG